MDVEHVGEGKAEYSEVKRRMKEVYDASVDLQCFP